ncbi:MAG: hypothetical protein KDN22_27900 [Verrucomicrobiae bacterium]|nr:hypothetical protein [Verrucomicrobiae bacterium]
MTTRMRLVGVGIGISYLYALSLWSGLKSDDPVASVLHASQATSDSHGAEGEVEVVVADTGASSSLGENGDSGTAHNLWQQLEFDLDTIRSMPALWIENDLGWQVSPVVARLLRLSDLQITELNTVLRREVETVRGSVSENAEKRSIDGIDYTVVTHDRRVYQEIETSLNFNVAAIVGGVRGELLLSAMLDDDNMKIRKMAGDSAPDEIWLRISEDRTTIEVIEAGDTWRSGGSCSVLFPPHPHPLLVRLRALYGHVIDIPNGEP